jgi:hypothetical protein
MIKINLLLLKKWRRIYSKTAKSKINYNFLTLIYKKYQNYWINFYQFQFYKLIGYIMYNLMVNVFITMKT